MDNKLIVGGIVAALLVLGGVGYAVMTRQNAPPPPEQVVPANQLTNELPPQTNKGASSDGAAHSTE